MSNLVNKNTEEKSYTLSIQLSLGGFSFCIYNHASEKFTFLKECKFPHKATSPEELLEFSKQVFKDEELLHQKYTQVQLIHHNDLGTLVPKEFFDENHLKDYLKYSIKVFDSDYITYDTIETLDIENVYIPFVNINNYVFEYFGSFNFFHSSSLLVNNVLKCFPNTTEKEMFVNVYEDNYQMVVLENGKLILLNHFNFKTEEDFVYYILFCAEQLKMDPNSFKLTLFGNIEVEHSNFLLLYKYVRNVNIFKKLNAKKSDSLNIAPQKYFNLLHQNL